MLAAVLALLATPGASAATDTSKLRDHVKLSKIVKHLQALQAIADANGGTRASGTPGYDASVDYLVPKLQEKGFLVTVQRFDFPFFQSSRIPSSKSFVEAGIGAGGLTSGSDHVKTAEQVALFGGTAGITMHPTYHTAADRLDTVNMKFLDDLSDAGAHAILWFAMDGQ